MITRADVIEIGYYPPERHALDAQLLAGMELLFPVRFQPCQASELGRYRACLIQATDLQEGVDLGRQCARALVLPAADATSVPKPSALLFADDAELDSALRGRRLEERCGPPCAELPEIGRVLASRDGVPVWRRTEDAGALTDWSGVTLPVPEQGESLTGYWSSRSFMRLLPLLHFLRELTATIDLAPPPPQACFIFDDPNLARPSYGHLRFRELAAVTAKQRCHVAVATVPLDAWRASPRVVELFHTNPDTLSLVIHGNNHTCMELQQERTEAECAALLAQALRRMARFTASTGLEISPVMEAPHGVITQSMFPPMAALGYEAVLVTPTQVTPLNRGRPWCDTLGLESMTVLPEGLCAIPRIVMSPAWRTDVALAAFLRQPVVIAGHQQDAAAGVGFLEALADSVGRDTLWTNPGAISRSRWRQRVDGERATLRLGARRVDWRIPPGVREVVIERPWIPAAGEESLVMDSAGMPSVRVMAGTVSVPLPLPAGAGAVLRIVSPPPAPLRWQDIPPPRRQCWPVVRRILTESRDRAAPWLPHGINAGAGDGQRVGADVR